MCLNHSEPNNNHLRKSEPKSEAINMTINRSQSFRLTEEPYHQISRNKLHKCDKCLKTFDYYHSMLRHMKSEHLVFFENSTLKDEEPPEVIKENSQLKAVYMNVNSLISKNKQYNVSKGIKESDADIVFLAETKRHKNSPEFKVQGYYEAKSLVRHASAGGLLVMAKKSIKLHSIVAKNVLPEIQVIQCMFNGQTIIAVYRSPTKKLMSVPEKDHHLALVDYLTLKIKNLKGKPYILVGDFNLGEIAENNFVDTTKKSTADHDNENISIKSYIIKLWSEFFHDHLLQQWVCDPTFPRYNSILDILMTPEGHCVDVTVKKDLFKGSFDHYALEFKIDTLFETNETKRTRRVKTYANWLHFKELLANEQLHTHLHLAQDAEQMAQYITQRMRIAYDTAIPEVEIKLPKDCYLQNDTKKATRRATRMRKALRRYIPGSNEYKSLKNKIKILDKRINKMMKNDRRLNQKKKLDKAKDQKKSFFKHFKDAKSKPSINVTGPVFDLEGKLKTTDQEVADAFGQLMGIQLKPGETKPNIDWYAEYAEAKIQIKKFYVSPDMVKKQINLSKVSASHGPDTIPMEAIHVAQEILAEPFAVLFNLINQTGVIPSLFKISRVKMLFKKGEKSEMMNYRPLAMSSHLGKIWERVINSHLVDHLENTQQLSDRQYGFRRTRGTTENLIRLQEYMVDRLEKEKSQLEVWNFDLKKAFDRVDHPKVLKLLHESGVNGTLGLCIENWLTNRQQYIEVENCRSEITEVGKSVIQGSVLGPSLWLLYVQSLTSKLDNLNVNYYAYADDISIVTRLKTDQDKTKFEEILKILQEWADHFDMEWSPLKTQRLVVGYHKCPVHPPIKMLFGGKEIVPLETTCVSLGVVLGKTNNFEEQRQKVYNTIKRLTANIRNSLEEISMFHMEQYYQSFVMPNLIYCCQLWNGGEEKQLEKIENAIQKFWKLSPTGRPPEEFTPVRILFILFDLNYTKKIKEGLTPLNFNEIFKIRENTRENANGRLPVPFSRLDISKTVFSTRARNFWNLLPKEIMDLNYPCFKKEAKKYVISNQKWFLNLGDRNGAGAKDLPPIKPYNPSKPIKMAPKTSKSLFSNLSSDKSL